MILKYNRFGTGIVLILSGLLIIYLSASVILKTLLIITSFIILLITVPALINAANDRKWKSYAFFDNLIMIIIACVLLLFPLEYISKIIGAFIFLLSLINLVSAKNKIEQIRKDLYRYIIALILVLVDPVDITNLVCWIIGLLLIVTGIILILNIKLPKTNKEPKSAIKDPEIIDVDDFHVHDD